MSMTTTPTKPLTKKQEAAIEVAYADAQAELLELDTVDSWHKNKATRIIDIDVCVRNVMKWRMNKVSLTRALDKVVELDPKVNDRAGAIRFSLRRIIGIK